LNTFEVFLIFFDCFNMGGGTNCIVSTYKNEKYQILKI